MRDLQSTGGSARARIASSDEGITMSGGTERSTRACTVHSALHTDQSLPVALLTDWRMDLC